LSGVSAKYEKLYKILVLDQRKFKPCEVKEVEQWSWKLFRNKKFLVHLKKHTYKWNIKPLP